LVPFLRAHLPELSRMRVLEVGCAEGGLLDVLHEQGVEAVGLELSAARVKIARGKNPALKVCVGDITDPGCREAVGGGFDLVVMRDVMEHIVEREAALRNIQALLRPGGYLYVSFPPKYSPFAGHQQVGRSFLRYVPFVHLLPAALVRVLGKIGGEWEYQLETIVGHGRHGLTIAAIERRCRALGVHPVSRALFVVRPIYRTRFGVRPLKAPNVPVLRECLTLGYEALWQLGGHGPHA
jgi:SAM-dependent methyltransferase